jgi:hypothetical protein
MSRLSDLLREAGTEAGGQLDATGQLLLGMVKQPVAGLTGASTGLWDLARGKGTDAALKSAVDQIDRVNAWGGPVTERGAQRLGELGETMHSAGDWATKNIPGVQQAGEGWDKYSAANPATAALSVGLLEAAPGPGKAKAGMRAAEQATTAAAGRAALLREGLNPESATKAAVEAAGRPKSIATVADPKRVSYPGVYDNPRELVARAKVAPEDPIMKQLFGVDRGDLLGISEGGGRQGTTAERPYFASERGKPNEAALAVSNPKNIQRLQDITQEGLNRPDLATGMLPWYVMDPMYQHYVRLWGPERAAQEFERFNNFTGMASPSSEVLTELRRGSAANRLHGEGRWDDFVKYGGMPYPTRVELLRQGQFPEDMMHIPGHMNHKTAHVKPMTTMIENNMTPDMGSAKVPSYIGASGVPETGFQTAHPIGDAHFSRIVGLPDTRNWTSTKGVTDVPRASATIPEMKIVGDMFREKVAEPAGLSGVGGQGLVWGAGSHATGVTSPIGAPKLELISQLIARTAKRLNISPEQARDLVITRKADLGRATPEAMAAAAAAGAGGTAMVRALRDDQGEQ